jgi:hypothetical protein
MYLICQVRAQPSFTQVRELLSLNSMSFHVLTHNLTLAVADAVRDACSDSFAGPQPTELHHYTDATSGGR